MFDDEYRSDDMAAAGGRAPLSNQGESTKPEAWVAVVRVPGNGAKKSKLIVALGGSAEEATIAAEGQWQKLWTDISRLH